MRRIPGLDGLRAISVLLVIWSHVGGIGGTFGVKVFFVISGYLITGLLLAERGRTGRISLKKFYIRRALRIFPAAYFYMICVALLAAAGLIVLQRGDLLMSFTYLMSYHETAAAHQLSHLWSLSVEEQFYWIWPAVLVIATASGRRIAFTVVLAMPVIRALLWFSGNRAVLLHLLPTAVDALAIGCFMAYGKLPKIRAPWLWLVLGCALMQVHPEALSFARKPFRLFQDSAVHLLIAAAVAGTVTAAGWWSTFLNSKVMVWLGTLSYSLYLWQGLFLFTDWPIPFRLGGTLASAALSYYFVEKPFLGLKKKFASEASVPVDSAALASAAG